VAAGDQVAEHGVQPAGDLVTQPGQVAVPLGPHFSTAGWSSAVTGRAVLDRSAATATDSASFGSFLFVSPACSSRTRDASFG
jgi:hypothetical protein